MGFLQGKIVNSVLHVAPWNKLLLSEAVFQAVSCSKSSVKLMCQTCLGKGMKQVPKNPEILGIPECVSCGAFFLVFFFFF